MWDIKQHEDWRDSKQQGTGGNHSRIRQKGHQAVEDNMDTKQQRAFRTFKRQRTVKTSSSTGFSGSGHQAAENSQDIKQKRFFRIRTSGGGGQSDNQAEKVFQDQDIRGRRTNGTSNSR